MINRRDFSLLFGALVGTDKPLAPAVPASDGMDAGALPSAIINARSFGARGDGIADDTRALQAFLDAVVRSGGHGYLPAGTYRTTAPLRVGDAENGYYRGFTIQGAGRAGLNGGRAIGGTLILYDGPPGAEAVVAWYGNAARDTRFTAIGLSSRALDGAAYGLLIRSSEVSHLVFDHLHVEHVTTAFGLMRGTGRNGEFCSWSHVQTWKVQSYFHTDTGQAYGLRFADSFCYFRPGKALFRMDIGDSGGGMRLINFDASPVVGVAESPTTLTDTSLIAISGAYNSPVTVIGGRYEHFSTLVRIDAGSTDLIVHNYIQFIGSDFTTTLTRDMVRRRRGTIELKRNALADLHFQGCSFAPALPPHDDLMVNICADAGCRGTVRFVQCGHWGYADAPAYDGPSGAALRLSWVDCTLNTPGAGSDYARRANGGRFERFVNEPAIARITLSAETGRSMLSDGGQWFEVPRVLVANAPPTEGMHQAGDLCRNANAGQGGPASWLCVESGEPGRWIAFAASSS
ncbi:MAG: glycosyl hydrolase family 28-related protein [Pseudomonadota bacterium]